MQHMLLWFRSRQAKLSSVPTTYAGFPENSVIFPACAFSRWHHCPLSVTAAYCWGHLYRARKILTQLLLSSAVASLLYVEGLPGWHRHTEKQCIRNECFPGQAQSKEGLFHPHQIPRRLILVVMQPGTCSSLTPTFHDQQWICIALTRSLQGWVSSQPSEITGAQPTPKSAVLPPDLAKAFTSLAAALNLFGCKCS